MPTKRKKQTRGKGPKSSQRAQGLPTETNVDPKPLRAMDFPIELQNAIFAGLEKSDLKNVRLVCHHWALLAVNFLFDKVYISAREKDLDVFRMASEHDTICKAVRTLVYDVTTFSPIGRLEDYYSDFQYDFLDAFSLSEDTSQEPFENPTRPFHHFINSLFQAQDMDYEMKVQHTHKNDAYIILEGYRTWQAHAQFEDYSMKGLLSKSLSSGLSRMNRLHSVALTSNIFHVNLLETESVDLDTMHCEYSGSPLSRSWHPLHLRPNAINPNVDPGGFLQKHFQNVIYGLDRSAPPIIQLSLLEDCNSPSVSRLGGLSQTILQTVLASKELHSLTLKPCRWLESFLLCIGPPYDESYRDPIALGILPKLLKEMQNLKHLQLGSKWEIYMTDTSHYNYKQIFSESCRWPQLESLSISGLAFENHEFVHLIHEQLPHLRRLEICRIDLLSGTWEAVVEFLRSSVCIKKLSHPHGVFDLTHQEGHLFNGGRRLPNMRLLRDPRAKDFSDRISHYVVHGGRHPCLPPGCEPSAAAGYLPSLWLYDSGFSDPGSIARLTPLEHYH